MRKWHRPRINALVEAGVDILALETIPSVVEAEMLINLVKEECPDVKAWLTFTVRVSKIWYALSEHMLLITFVRSLLCVGKYVFVPRKVHLSKIIKQWI